MKETGQGTQMSDLEMTKLCGESLGLQMIVVSGLMWAIPAGTSIADGKFFHYSPLTDDAQAMALVKKLRMSIEHVGGGQWLVENDGATDCELGADLNRAIVECVAKSKGEK